MRTLRWSQRQGRQALKLFGSLGSPTATRAKIGISGWSAHTVDGLPETLRSLLADSRSCVDKSIVVWRRRVKKTDKTYTFVGRVEREEESGLPITRRKC